MVVFELVIVLLNLVLWWVRVSMKKLVVEFVLMLMMFLLLRCGRMWLMVVCVIVCLS